MTTTHLASTATTASQVSPRLNNDSLLASVAWLCAYHDMPQSEHALRSGMAQARSFTPSLAMEAFKRAGLSAGLVQRHPAHLFSALLPALLLRKDGGAFLLLSRTGTGDHLQYQIMLTETGGTTSIDATAMQEMHSGYLILVKKILAPDRRAGEAMPEAAGHWLWSTLWRYRRYYLSAAAAAVLVNILALASTFFTMNVYDRVVPNQAYVTLWSLAIGVGLAMLMEFAARHVRATLLDIAGKKADLILGARLFRQAMAIRMECKPASSGSFANQLREFESVRDFATSATLAALTDLPFVLLFIGVIYFIGGPLAWVPLGSIPLIILVSALIQWPLARTMRENLREGSLKQGVLIEAIEGLETLKASSGEGYMQKRWERYSALMSATAMKSRLLSGLATNFVTLVQQFNTVIMVVWGVYLIGAGSMTMGALIGTVLLSGRAVGPLAQLVGLAVRFQQAKAALQSLNKLMAMPVERPPEKSFLGAPTLAGNLLLKELQFHYPAAPGQTPTPVLDKINLHIMPGERVAILGRIGSGKSSLLRILARLYQPVGGQLFMDGIDAAQIDPADWRAHVGFVGQETRLFYGRLSENIMLGRPDASVDDVLRVARMTGVDRIAASHPHGYARIIGEMGEGLSGGQRQLVGLARCLLANPKILLMDEPTSSMDAQTEAIFMQHLSASLGPEQSLVLVTHRMSLLDVADRILVLDEGKIVADGPKEEVLRTLRNNAEKAAAQADATRHGRVAA